MSETLTSHDKEKLVIDKTYWTFYMETTSKGDSLRNVIPVFRTKLISKTNNPWGVSLSFDTTEIPNCGDTMKHNLPIFMGGYGSAYCEFYDTEEEAKEGFDNKIRQHGNGISAAKRDIMYKKMYTKSSAVKSTLELKAKEWVANLSLEEQNYLDWWVDNI